MFQDINGKPWIFRRCCIKINELGPDWVAQLIRALSQYAKVMGSIPSQGTCKNQPMNA